MSEPRGCLFCGARPLTSAHILSSKLQSMLPAFDLGTDMVDEWVDPETLEPNERTLSMSVSPLNQQVKRLCQRCNGSWMNDLEEATRGNVAAMALGKDVRLTFKQQTALAAWAFTIAMLRATQAPGVSMFSDEDRAALRYTNVAPPGSLVWAVRAGETRGAWSAHHRIAVNDVKGQVTAYWIGKLLLVMASGSTVPIIRQRLIEIRSAAAPLKPASPTALKWPPRDELPGPYVDAFTFVG